MLIFTYSLNLFLVQPLRSIKHSLGFHLIFLEHSLVFLF